MGQRRRLQRQPKKRANSPPVGLVTSDNDLDGPAKQYAFDPDRDPELVFSAVGTPDLDCVCCRGRKERRNAARKTPYHTALCR